MPDDAILRQEYEARSAMISNDINKLETKIDNLNNKVETRFETLNNKVDSISTGWWKFVAITSINFILGGGLVATIEFFVNRK